MSAASESRGLTSMVAALNKSLFIIRKALCLGVQRKLAKIYIEIKGLKHIAMSTMDNFFFFQRKEQQEAGKDSQTSNSAEAQGHIDTNQDKVLQDDSHSGKEDIPSTEGYPSNTGFPSTSGLPSLDDVKNIRKSEMEFFHFPEETNPQGAGRR